MTLERAQELQRKWRKTGGATGLAARGESAFGPDIVDRKSALAWCAWCDRNGCYTDEDSMAEFGEIVSEEDAYRHVEHLLNG